MNNKIYKSEKVRVGTKEDPNLTFCLFQYITSHMPSSDSQCMKSETLNSIQLQAILVFRSK